MKPNLFKYSVLMVGIAAAMGITSTSNAASSKADSTPTIENMAMATYKVGGVAQTPVESNKVTVNITQSAAFSLEATNTDGNTADDFNKGLTVTPNGRVVFNHTLSNVGNVKDTYTLNLVQGGSGATQDISSYDLDKTNVTYIIYNADKTVKSSKTVTGTVFQNGTGTVVELAPGETVGIEISAKTKENVGGNSQNLTLSASSTFFAADTTKATLTNINNSVTKVPVFQITSKVSNTINLNDPSSKATYTITVRNDNGATYAADANNIIVFDGLPAGLRLADAPNIKVDNGANIVAGKGGFGTGAADDSVTVTLLNLKAGETATITFDVQRDTAEPLENPKNTINHAVVTLDLLEGEIIYDSTDPTDTKQNTKRYYPAKDDSEVLTGAANNEVGGDSAAPLIANQRGLEITAPKPATEIPTTTSGTTQVTQTVTITNNGQETEGNAAGEVKFTIAPADAKNTVTVVTGSVEIAYDHDKNPATPDYIYTITRVNGINDLSTAVPKAGAPAWTGIAPGTSVTISYKVESKDAMIDTTEKTIVNMVVGGTDAPTTGSRNVENNTTVKGLKLVKQQALNETCLPTATLTFTTSQIPAKPGQCIVYKISAFNNFTDTDSRFTFNNLIISDTIGRFNNKAKVLSSTTTPAFDIKLDNVANDTTVPAANTYTAALDNIEVSGTVTSLAPQKYAAMMFAVKINDTGAEVTP